MRYIDKLKKEHPEHVDDNYCGGAYGCPGFYFPEATYPHKPECRPTDAKCRECWNREEEKK